MNKKNKVNRQENKTPSSRTMFYAKIIIFVISGAIMIGHGSRMIYQGIFAPGTYYAPNVFDLFFDWLTLAILGGFILLIALSQFYKNCSKNKMKTISRKIHPEDKLIHHPT